MKEKKDWKVGDKQHNDTLARFGNRFDPELVKLVADAVTWHLEDSDEEHKQDLRVSCDELRDILLFAVTRAVLENDGNWLRRLADLAEAIGPDLDGLQDKQRLWLMGMCDSIQGTGQKRGPKKLSVKKKRLRKRMTAAEKRTRDTGVNPRPSVKPSKPVSLKAIETASDTLANTVAESAKSNDLDLIENPVDRRRLSEQVNEMGLKTVKGKRGRPKGSLNRRDTSGK